jgi:hypothetical protein
MHAVWNAPKQECTVVYVARNALSNEAMGGGEVDSYGKRYNHSRVPNCAATRRAASASSSG